jgi:hypothetical protein
MIPWLQANIKRLASIGLFLAAAGGIYGLLGYISNLAAITFISSLVQAALLLCAYLAYLPVSLTEPSRAIVQRLRTLVSPKARKKDLAENDSSGVLAEGVHAQLDNRHSTVLFGINVLSLGVFIFAVLITGLRTSSSSASALLSGLWIPFAGTLLGASRLFRYLRYLAGTRDYIQLIARYLVGAAVIGVGGGVLALALNRFAQHPSAFDFFTQMDGGLLSLIAEGILICALGVAFTSAAIDDVAWISIAVGVMAVGFGIAEWIADAARYGFAVITMGLLCAAFGFCVFTSAPLKLTQAILVTIGIASVAVAVFANSAKQPEVTVSSALLSVAVLAYAVSLNIEHWLPEASRRLEESARPFTARLGILHLQAAPSFWVNIRLVVSLVGLVTSGYLLWRLVILHQVGAAWGFAGVSTALLLIVVIQVVALLRKQGAGWASESSGPQL